MSMRIAPGRRLAASACLLFGASLLSAYAGISSQADERAPPPNAHASRYGGDWECSRGFRQVEEACVAIRVPANAYLDSFGNDWDCNRGYMKDDQGLGCKAVKVPANAHVEDEEAFGTGWECDLGYRSRRPLHAGCGAGECVLLGVFLRPQLGVRSRLSARRGDMYGRANARPRVSGGRAR